MKTQEKIIKFLIFVLILILSVSIHTSVFASDLKISVTTDKESYKANETIAVTVDWKEKMQAASFKIGYDSDKLEFVSANIDETFYNKQTAGEISVNWVSFDGKELTQVIFQFKALKGGKADVSIKDAPSFADGNLVSPTSYDISTLGTKTITIATEKTEEKVEEKKDNNQINAKQDNYQSQEKEEDKSISKKDIPKAGLNENILLISIVIGALAVVFFIKNKKYSGI